MSPEDLARLAIIIALWFLPVVIIIGMLRAGPHLHRLARALGDLRDIHLETTQDARKHHLWVEEQAERAARAEADALAREERDAAQAREDDELLRAAGDHARQSMVLVATMADIIRQPPAAPEALTLPAREGWDMATAQLVTQLKQGLQESRKKPTTQETP